MRVTFEKLAAKGVGGELLGGELGVAGSQIGIAVQTTETPDLP